MEGLEVKQEKMLVPEGAGLGSGSSDEEDSDNLKHDAFKVADTLTSYEAFNMREVIITLPGGAEMRFNPVASLFGSGTLWGLAM